MIFIKAKKDQVLLAEEQLRNNGFEHVSDNHLDKILAGEVAITHKQFEKLIQIPDVDVWMELLEKKCFKSQKTETII